jgi:hypothetical protein
VKIGGGKKVENIPEKSQKIGTKKIKISNV